MHYPSELLPCPERKLIKDSISDFYLIRYFKVFEEHELKNSDNKLNNIYIFGEANGSTRRLIDLSTVLHGVYKEEHVKLQLTSEGVLEYKDYCPPDCNVNPPIFENHFIVDNEMRFWAIKISDLENEKLKYHNVNLEKDFYAQCKIIHSPKKSNFWHYSIDWEIEEGLFKNLLAKNRGFEKKAKKRYGAQCRALLEKHVVLKCPEDVEIPESHYLK